MMTDTPLATPDLRSALPYPWQDQRAWPTSALILGLLAVFDAPRAAESALFAVDGLSNPAPFLS